MRRPLSITTRVLLGTLAAVLAVMGLTSFYLNASLARLFQREGNRTLEEMADKVVERLDAEHEDWFPAPPEPDEPTDSKESTPTPPHPVAPPAPPEPPKLTRDLLEDTEQIEVRIVHQSGKVLLESEGFSRLLPQARLEPVGGWTWKDVDGPTGAQFLVHAKRFEGGWVFTAWDIRRENRLLRQSQDLLVAAWGSAALLSALLVAVLTRRGLHPLRTLTTHAEGIRPGALHLDLDPDLLPGELGPLVQALRAALARLDEAFGRLTSLNADVAHELRTPLHGIRLEVEGLLSHAQPQDEESLEGLVETLDHLSSTLDQMLFLARAEDPAMALQAVELDAAALLRQAAAPFESLAEEKALELTCEAPEGLRVKADELLARRALHNLLANAIRHAPEGSVVHLEAVSEPGCVTLQVRDEGEGMPAEFLARIGQRFLRPDRSRNRATGGAGLGLAIVTTILRLHGGTLSYLSSPGKGTLARLHFPE